MEFSSFDTTLETRFNTDCWYFDIFIAQLKATGIIHNQMDEFWSTYVMILKHTMKEWTRKKGILFWACYIPENGISVNRTEILVFLFLRVFHQQSKIMLIYDSELEFQQLRIRGQTYKSSATSRNDIKARRLVMKLNVTDQELRSSITKVSPTKT